MRSDVGGAARLVVSERAVSKHIGTIFAKLGLDPDEDDNRRAPAVPASLNADPK